MAVLTTAARKKLKPSVFGLPEKRAYPMPDEAHAVDAKGRAKQQLNKGNLSRAEYDRIVTMANHIIAGARSS